MMNLTDFKSVITQTIKHSGDGDYRAKFLGRITRNVKKIYSFDLDIAYQDLERYIDLVILKVFPSENNYGRFISSLVFLEAIIGKSNCPVEQVVELWVSSLNRGKVFEWFEWRELYKRFEPLYSTLQNDQTRD